MIILHAVQKLLNTSGLKPALYLSAPTDGQHMHSWYVKLASAGFPGKLLTMYVHEPSLLTVLTAGRSIKTTLPQFYERLPQLLQRHNFRQDFIEKEMEFVVQGHIVSKTNSKSMLGFMNEMTFQIENRCFNYPTYALIDLSCEEDIFMNWLSFDNISRRYRLTRDYWAERGFLLT